METRILLLSLLLSAVVATRSVVEAKTTVSRIEFSSSAIKYKASERLLENDGQSAVEAFLSEHPQNDESVTNSIINDSGYDPYPDGTAVRYQDQDGTWMNGRIDTYNSDTKVYTVKWDEDNVLEDFSDLNKVDQLVANAEEQVQITNTEEQVTETNDDEVDEQFDWDDDEKLGQAPSSNGSPYRGSVPEDFDFGYTYQYDNLADYEPWPIGTVTLLEFSDGWYEGKITSFSLSEDKTNATYVVTWSDGTGDRFVNELEWMDLMVANAQHYEPWSIGTQTYGYPNPDENDPDSEKFYLDGEITLFADGAYTITWSNGEAVVYSDFDEVDEFVNNAAAYFDPDQFNGYNPWPINTPVSWDFDDGWWDGTITGFEDGVYEVTWSDGTNKYYSNFEKIDQMVAFGAGEGFLEGPSESYSSGDDYYAISGYYELGTLVYAKFEDGWWAGYIDSYDDDYYIVLWSDESSDRFLPGPDMDEMVNNAQYIQYDFNLYPEGTQVYAEFNGYWYWGTIEHSESGFYEILWEDGERTVHVAGAYLDDMVSNAYYAGNSGNVLSTFGIVALLMIVLGGSGGLAFFYMRRGRKQRRSAELTEQVQENELDLDEDIASGSEYTDEPNGRIRANVV